MIVSYQLLGKRKTTPYLSLPFWGALCFYIFYRLWALGVPTIGSNNTSNFSGIRDMLYSIIASTEGFMGYLGKMHYQGFPPLVWHIILLAVCLLLFIYFFIRSKDKSKLLLYLVCFILAVWRIPVCGPEIRYFDISVPFFLLLFWEMVLFYSKIISKIYYRFITIVIFVLFTTFGVFNNINALLIREKYSHLLNRSIRNLPEEYICGDRDPFFLFTFRRYERMDCFVNVGLSATIRYYYDTDKQFGGVGCLVMMKQVVEGDFEIVSVKKGFKFISHQSDVVFLQGHANLEEGKAYKINEGVFITVIKKSSKVKWGIAEVEYTFSDAFIESKPRFLFLDPIQWRFCELKPK